MSDAEVITPREWSAALAASESPWSPLHGPAVVVVDGDWGQGEAPVAGSRRPLVPVIGRVGETLDVRHQALADLCDVLVGTVGDEAPGAVAGAEEAIGLIVERVGARPHAATVLCQLLRRSGDADVADGLLLESLAYSTLQAGAEHLRWLDDRAGAERPSRPRPPPSAPSEVIELDRAGAVLSIRLDRPEVHNALDVALRDRLAEALDLAALDRSITEVRLSGKGPSFCSGGDLGEFGTVGDPTVGHLVRSHRLPARSLARVADRVQVTVHGASVGAGVELAAFAWAVVARPGATFRLPEVGMGLVPGAGGTVSLPRRIGRHRTAWLGLSGVEIGVTRAREWGLVDRVLDGP